MTKRTNSFGIAAIRSSWSGALTLLLCCLLNSQARAEDRFGAIVCLTGTCADQGEWARRGFAIAQAEAERELGKKITLDIEDSKGGDARTSVAAYQSLKTRGPLSVIFTQSSGVGVALTPLVNIDRVIQIGVATATPKYTTPADFTFRTFPSAAKESELLVQHLAKETSKPKLAILYIESDYGVETAQAIKDTYLKAGGEVSLFESYHPDHVDFRTLHYKPLRTILLKVKQSDSQAVVITSYPADGALLLAQNRLMLDRQFDVSTDIIGSNFFNLTYGADGLEIVLAPINIDSPFIKEYRRLYPGESAAQLIFAARAYDAFKVATLALKQCDGANTECLKQKLFEVKDFDGASGRFSFDGNGDIETTFTLCRLQGNSCEPVNP